MKRALIITAIILLIAAVVGVVLLGGLMMNNYAKTGSVFGSGFDFSGGFWENIIGDEVLDGIETDTPPELPSGEETPKETEEETEKETVMIPEEIYLDGVFVSDNTFVYEPLEDGSYAVAVDGFLASDGVLQFPSSFKGSPITAILKSPTANKKDKFDVKKAIIPDTIMWIEEEAFANYRNLEYIKLSNNMLEVPKSLFEGCYTLKTVVLGSNTVEIADMAFLGCTALENIELPLTLKKIGQNAFCGCKSLKEIRFPQGLEQIGESAFRGCYSLESIVLPSSVVDVGAYAFNCCTSATFAKLPDNAHEISNHMFSGCSSLTEVIIPDTVTRIRNGAFSGCKSLSSIDLPDGLTVIESSAFWGCESLKSIHLPASLREIHSPIINKNYCESITVDTRNPYFHISDNCLIETESKTIVLACSTGVIPEDESVNAIGEYAFAFYPHESITIPKNIKTIGNNALASVNLVQLRFDGTLEEWDNITKHKNWLYYDQHITVICTDGEIEY